MITIEVYGSFETLKDLYDVYGGEGNVEQGDFTEVTLEETVSNHFSLRVPLDLIFGYDKTWRCKIDLFKLKKQYKNKSPF